MANALKNHSGFYFENNLQGGGEMAKIGIRDTMVAWSKVAAEEVISVGLLDILRRTKICQSVRYSTGGEVKDNAEQFYLSNWKMRLP